MRDRWQLITAIGLILAGLAGMSIQGDAAWRGGDTGWGMHRGPMMGWWTNEADTESAPEISGAASLRAEATEFGFSPARLEATVGEAVNIELSNEGALLHDLSIPELGFQIVAAPGEVAVGGLNVPDPGEYRFLCTVPGHSAAGMVGVLVVGDGA